MKVMLTVVIFTSLKVPIKDSLYLIEKKHDSHFQIFLYMDNGTTVSK